MLLKNLSLDAGTQLTGMLVLWRGDPGTVRTLTFDLSLESKIALCAVFPREVLQLPIHGRREYWNIRYLEKYRAR